MIYIKYIDIVVIFLVISVNVQTTFAVSCENIVRLADLKDIIRNQTKLIQQQGQVIEDQKSMLENQTRLVEDLQRRLQYVTTGKTETQFLFENLGHLIQFFLNYDLPNLLHLSKITTD